MSRHLWALGPMCKLVNRFELTPILLFKTTMAMEMPSFLILSYAFALYLFNSINACLFGFNNI